MAKQVINVGVSANDSTGDSLRVAGGKINNNFTELYNALGGETGAPLSIVSEIVAGKGIIVSSATGNVLVTNKVATESEVGGIRIGSGISIDTDGIASVAVYELPKASTSILGGVKVGDRLSIDANGVLSADPGAYTLPKASNTVLGGVKVGAGLVINGSGVLSVSYSEYSLPTASDTVLGGVKVGSRLSIIDGVLSADIQSIGQTDTLTASNKTVVLGTDGRLRLPSQGIYVNDNGVITVTGATTSIYSTNGHYVRGIKMTIFAEKFANGYESQICELLGVIEETTNTIYSTTFGVIYSGAQALFTLSSDYNIVTTSYHINATPAGPDPVYIRTLVTELYGTD